MGIKRLGYRLRNVTGDLVAWIWLAPGPRSKCRWTAKCISDASMQPLSSDIPGLSLSFFVLFDICRQPLRLPIIFGSSLAQGIFHINIPDPGTAPATIQYALSRVHRNHTRVSPRIDNIWLLPEFDSQFLLRRTVCFAVYITNSIWYLEEDLDIFDRGRPWNVR